MKVNLGIKALIEMYKKMFRIPENLNHYSKKDFRKAERKFLKHALGQSRIDNEGELFQQ